MTSSFRRTLGRTDLSIAPLVFGGNVFGWTADEQRSFALLDRFVERGFNAVDTADVYSRFAPGNVGGESETIIGDWMRARGSRDRIVLITKVGNDMGEGRKGLSAAYIARAVDDSLRRLRTDRIDLYFTHRPDPAVPVAETLGAYQRLIEAGKIRHCAVSNASPAELREALDVSARHGLPRYEVLQPGYNLVDRSDFEGPLRDICMAEELGVISYYGLARGFLSGKYRGEADLAGSARGAGIRQYLTPRGMRVLAALDAVAREHGASVAEVALAWVARRPGITAPIASATSLEQLDSLLRSTELSLTHADMEALNAASPE